MNEHYPIRVIAFCLFVNNNKTLVSKGYDEVSKEVFYRPLGGGLEFREKSIDALKRELKEEINAEIDDIHFLGVIENIFTYKGVDKHEIHFVYSGKFTNPELYEAKTLIGIEGNGKSFIAEWIDINQFIDKTFPLYPEGTLKILLNNLAS